MIRRSLGENSRFPIDYWISMECLEIDTHLKVEETFRLKPKKAKFVFFHRS